VDGFGTAPNLLFTYFSAKTIIEPVREEAMNWSSIWRIGLFLIGYVLLTWVILPRLGVPT
jgi:hypothetical protein